MAAGFTINPPGCCIIALFILIGAAACGRRDMPALGEEAKKSAVKLTFLLLNPYPFPIEGFLGNID